MQALTIGEVAKRTGVGVDTVRFYEREGLIAEPPRRPSGYRQYPPETVRRVRFIRRAKELGFTLPEILELLELSARRGQRSASVRDRAEAKVVVLEQKIRDLERMKDALERLVQACKCRSESIDRCPILEALDEESEEHERARP